MLDIVKITNGSRRYTLHSHTQFCDGHSDMESFVKAAIDVGFDFYGFSPHSPIPIESGCNMSRESVAAYLAEVDRLRHIYGDKIDLYAGMEIDYLDESWGPSVDYFQKLPLDYRIGSVHFIADQRGEFVDIDGSADRFKINMARHFDDDIHYVVNTFVEASARMIEAGGFDIIGHFDKIAQNASYYQPGIEDEAWFRALIDDLVSLIVSRKPIVEINTKAKIRHGRIFPSERHLGRLVAAGVPIVVNSDAHDPELIDASLQYAFDLLDNITHGNT